MLYYGSHGYTCNCAWLIIFNALIFALTKLFNSADLPTIKKKYKKKN